MTERLANRITGHMLRVGAAAEKDREALAFGIYLMLADAQQIALLAAAAALLGTWLEVLVFTLCYATLRKYIGGAHARSHIGCLVSFTALAAVLPLLCARCPANAVRPLSITLAAWMLLLVFGKAPVMHPNSPKSRKSLARFRVLGRRVAVIQFVAAALCTGLLPDGPSPLALCGSCGGWMAAMTLILPMPKTEGGENG